MTQWGRVEQTSAIVVATLSELAGLSSGCRGSSHRATVELRRHSALVLRVTHCHEIKALLSFENKFAHNVAASVLEHVHLAVKQLNNTIRHGLEQRVKIARDMTNSMELSVHDSVLNRMSVRIANKARI